MKKFKSTLRLLGTILFTLVLYSTASSQVIDGRDYSDRKEVYNTFDMASTGVFGQRFPSEHFTLNDKETGVEIIALTTSRRSSSKMYQALPQWTPDGKYIVFSSHHPNAESKEPQAYAISMKNYEIVQITPSDWGSNLHLGWP